jgi:hypothetical protein
MLVSIFSCSQDYGNLLESDELNMYYSHPKIEEKAREVATYFKENNLIGSKKQFLRLEELKSGFTLFMIASEGFDKEKISFDEKKTLLDFQKNLQKGLFPNNNFRIVISDNQFQPIWDINR